MLPSGMIVLQKIVPLVCAPVRSAPISEVSLRLACTIEVPPSLVERPNPSFGLPRETDRVRVRGWAPRRSECSLLSESL